MSDFVAETREGLEALDSELVRFEQSPDDPETLGRIFRLIHTIKGTCGFLGLSRLQTVAHSAENVLGGFRDSVLPVTRVAVSAVLDTVDLIRAIIDSLAVTGVEPPGDDSALISRLEAILNDASPDEVTSTGPAIEPSLPEPTNDGRKLIDRLGGDATLDAAAESALMSIQSNPDFGALFADADIDRLQAAIRDSLSTLARSEHPGPAFVTSMTDVGSIGVNSKVCEGVFDIVANALFELDIDPNATAALRNLLLLADAADQSPLAAASSPQASASASPNPSETGTATTGATAAEAPRVRSDGEALGVGGGAGPAQTIRVSVDALEHLMTVVSELVLIRNQLIQTLRLEPESPFAAPLNRLNQVTSELQEGVMTTRMQPIGGAWSKLPRLVRDLSQDLGKSIELVMHGQETELDRQVLELIKDPLTHMIRNAADHGLETPTERRAAGKSETGKIVLQARHEGGAIVIEVGDDGRGLPADKIRAKALASGLISQTQHDSMSDAEARQLIFHAGLSTASEVTSVSGRGVGMDVVRANIEKIGGAIELTSVQGSGTRFTIRIPLTLTIVSALIVECCGDRFAMPQSSIVELVSANGAGGRTIEYIDGSAVLRLRDRLLPLVSLQSLLELQPTETSAGETCIVVVKIGSFTFGVMVDKVFDTEEIVVKPVATVLRHLKLYSGATIMGDGSVILILDLKGLSAETGAGQGSGIQDEPVGEVASAREEQSAILVFRAANERLKATPLADVARIEEIASSQIEYVDGRTVVQYRGQLMPIVGTEAEPAAGWDDDDRRPLLVFARDDQAVGLLVHEIVDIVESTLKADLSCAGAGTLGSLIIGGAATELINVAYYWRKAMNRPEQADAMPDTPVAAPPPVVAQPTRRLLVIDESPFSQLLLRPLLAQAGYDVVVASDSETALSLYEAGESFHLIIADTSRPESTRKFASTLKTATRWHATPLVSLAAHKNSAAALGSESTLLEAVSDALVDHWEAA